MAAAKLEPTSTPGIFRRHRKDCPRNGRCECAYAVVWRHRGRQHMETYRTLGEAREAKHGREAGDRRPTARLAFGDYFGEWIESYAGRTERGFSETTRPEYRRPIDTHAVPRWGTWRLADIEPADVRDMFGDLRRTGATTSGIKKLRAALSALFATAVEDGLLRTNPVQGVRIPSARDDPEVPSEERAKALTRHELALLLGEMGEDWRPFFQFLAHTGVRVSEAVGLTWAHVDLGSQPRVRIREQVYRGERRPLKSSYARRDIPLSPDMAATLLTRRRDDYLGDSSPVFPSGAGTELHPSNVRRRVLMPAAEPVGLGWVGFHTLRHTCASLLFAEGRNVKQVQEWLGHSDPGFTLRTYVHLMDDGVGGAEFLDQAVRVNAGSTGGPQTAANREAAVSEKVAG